MKKITRKRKLWFKIIIKKRGYRLSVSKTKKKIKNCIKSNGCLPKNIKYKYFKITGPEKLGFAYGKESKSRKFFISWIKRLNYLTINNNQRVIIDFSYSKDADSFGFLLMLATIDRIVNLKGRGFIKGIKPIDDIAQQLFKQVGLSDLLNIDIENTITAENVRYWHYINGTKIEADNAGKLILKLCGESGINDELVEDLYNGVTEAMTNTVMHAYDSSIYRKELNEKNKWYMFTTTKDDHLTVVMCDIGIGIPGSLKLKHENFVEKFKGLFVRRKEGQLIQKAIKERLTKTQQSHRGYGMAEMKKFINRAGTGKLWIMSSRGTYQYFGDGDREKCLDYDNPMPGTMVGWRIPLETITNIEN